MSTAVLIDSTKTASTIDIICRYNNNCDDAYFDGITLVPSTDSVKYVYNEEGKVVKSVNGSAENVQYTYNDNNLVTKATYYDGSVYEYTYNTCKDVVTETHNKGTAQIYKTTNEYDVRGQIVSVSTEGTTSGSEMIASYTYSTEMASFGKLLTATDTNGDTVTNIYNGTGLYCGLLSSTVGNDGKGCFNVIKKTAKGYTVRH